MLHTMTLARPYARAAFAYAHAHRLVDQWAEALHDIALLIAHEIVAEYLANPKVSSQQAMHLLKEIFADIIDKPLENFLRLLAVARQWDLLPNVFKLFEQYANDDRQTETVKVYAARTLSIAQQKKLQRALTHRLKKQMKLDCNIVPELIGGVVIVTQRWILDASVKGRLQQLKARLVG